MRSDSPSRPAFTQCNLFNLPLEAVIAHNGVGEILTCRLADSDSVSGACNFMDFTTMPPGTTIGLHRHRQDEEEYYLILEGRGQMQIEDRCLSVGPGDLVRNPPGGSHALKNTGTEELRLFVFELQVRSARS